MAGYSSIPSLLRSCIIKKLQLGNQISKGNNSTILEGKWEGSVVAVKQVHIAENVNSTPDWAWVTVFALTRTFHCPWKPNEQQYPYFKGNGS